MDYQTLAVSLQNHVAHIELNRPDKANALNETMWNEIRTAFRWADETGEARAVVLSGRGKHFCAGIDLISFAGVQQMVADKDQARMREKLRRQILDMQDCMSVIERCRKPVLAAMHGACVGFAIDMTTCCDMRYSTTDAFFSVKEIDIGMAADVGTLQRLPKLIPDGMARELAYTGRKMAGDEAQRIGLVNRCFDNQEALMAGVMQIAQDIAQKSPLAMRGTKEMLLYARDHGVADGLNYIATWNAAMLLSDDLQEAMAASMQKRPAKFAD
ncbi:MAG: crotonase/enoyl-CoA hydratase family protein [Burkholderiales bacterium]